MTRSGTLGLVGAGLLSRSFLLKLPALARDLGPVISPSYRLASRLVNSMRAGYPVEDYDGLQDARTLIIAVPDELLPTVLAKLVSASLEWAGKVVLLCDSPRESSELDPLAKRGAAVGSLSPIPGLAHRYVVEGDRRAVRAARCLIEDGPSRAFELPRGQKAVFQAALCFAGPLLLTVADASSRCLRAAGLPAPACNHVGGQLLQRTLRSHLHAGRKAWSGLPEAPQLRRQLAALEASDPELARCYRALTVLAAEWFEGSGERIAEIFTAGVQPRGEAGKHRSRL